MSDLIWSCAQGAGPPPPSISLPYCHHQSGHQYQINPIHWHGLAWALAGVGRHGPMVGWGSGVGMQDQAVTSVSVTVTQSIVGVTVRKTTGSSQPAEVWLGVGLPYLISMLIPRFENK
jgi:hypothetical protein